MEEKLEERYVFGVYGLNQNSFLILIKDIQEGKSMWMSSKAYESVVKKYKLKLLDGLYYGHKV